MKTDDILWLVFYGGLIVAAPALLAHFAVAVPRWRTAMSFTRGVFLSGLAPTIVAGLILIVRRYI
jgi:hypothetical protein